MEDMQAALYRLDARAMAIELLLTSLLRVLAERSPTSREIVEETLKRAKLTMAELASRSLGSTPEEVQISRVERCLVAMEGALGLVDLRKGGPDVPPD